MHKNIGVLTCGHENHYYDVTHSFKIDSSTYHILGLRKDRPTYQNTYYIFNCPNCTEEYALKESSKVNRHAANRPRPSTGIPKKANSGTIGIEEAVTKLLQREQHTLITSLHRKMKAENETLITSVHKSMKTENETLITSLRKSMKTENETLMRSIEETSKKVQLESKTIEQKLNEILNTERQTTINSFRTEMTSNNKTLMNLIENSQNKVEYSTEILEQKLIEILQNERHKIIEAFRTEIRSEYTQLIQSSKEVIQQELTSLFEEQQRKIQSIHEEHININNSSLKTKSQTVNLEQKHISELNAFEIKLNQSIETQITQSLSKTVEKLDSIILQIVHDGKRPTPGGSTGGTDINIVNHLFAEQKQFIMNTITEQNSICMMNMKKIIQGASSSGKISPTVVPYRGPFIDSQGSSNAPDRHLFKVAIKSPEPVSLFAKIFIDNQEYPEKSHTLCQQDPVQSDEVICYVAPPSVEGPYSVIIYAKTNAETTYRAAVSIQIPGPNITQSVFFPYTFAVFEEHRCILIEPLQSLLHYNADVWIHMIIPQAKAVKIQNGNTSVAIDHDDFVNGELKKQVKVCGDVYVFGQWNDETDSPICFFYVV